MAFIVQSTDIIGTSTGIAPATGDKILILEGVNVVSTASAGISGSFGINDVEVIVAGSVVGNLEALILLGVNATVTVTETGSLIGTKFNGSTGALNFEGIDANAVNHGTIIGTDMYGVFFGDPGASLNNTGQISGVSGVLLWDDDSTIVNSGTIMGHATDRTQDYNDNGVAVRGDDSIITNLAGGIIGTTSQDGSGIVYTSGFTGDSATVNNFGQINGGAYGVVNFDLGTNVVIDINNAGTIIGGIAGILGNAGVEDITNSGLIVGDVNLEGNDDIYEGSGNGRVDGWVYGGAGADELLGSDAIDQFDGGDDADLISGRGGNDVLYGEGSGDDMFGGDGNDDMYGGSGADMLNGGAGEDVLYGGAKDDDLMGRSGDDVLYGDSGNDFLFGNAGDDEIIGGTGADRMNGGGGADVFIYLTSADTGLSAERDDIRNFDITEDKIDLTAVADDIIWLGTGNFTATGETELSYKTRANGNTNVSLDLDGDGNTDMEIILYQTSGISIDNFVF